MRYMTIMQDWTRYVRYFIDWYIQIRMMVVVYCAIDRSGLRLTSSSARRVCRRRSGGFNNMVSNSSLVY